MEAQTNQIKNGANAKALLPIGIFLVLYLGLGILFEYVLKVPMGFYNIPIVVVFVIALLTACLQNRKITFDEKLEIMGRGVGDKNIITMILIFLLAGMFVVSAFDLLPNLIYPYMLFFSSLLFIFIIPEKK